MQLNFASLFFLASTLVTSMASAEDRYLMIGGGATPDSSQVSIESNVVWFNEILGDYGFNGGRTLYASGYHNSADVALHTPDDPDVQHWLPLARLNAEHERALTTFRQNKISWAESGADKPSVESVLNQELTRLRANDSLLILYSGHGSHKPRDVSGNALRLWGETPFNVNDFRRQLEAADTSSKVRYVLPQCFSGAFARSIVPMPSKPKLDGVRGNQCGFFAVSEDVIAEGCTPSVDTGDYRDYATYFFAALAGKTRTGEALKRNPDIDSDGEISLREAHLYAYTEGFSTDVPRTTSDYYLELWEPWYVRWHSFVPLQSENNPYLVMANQLASNYGVNTNSTAAMSDAALKQRAILQDKIRTTQKQQQKLKREAEKLRKTIRKQFLLKWPNAQHTDSAAYARFIAEESAAALQWIRNQKDYPQLAELQDQVSQLSLQTLELQREEAQYIRINRALKLAAILENFRRLADDKHQKTYEALVACEDWTPPKQGRTAALPDLATPEATNP